MATVAATVESLGNYRPALESALRGLDSNEIIPRIWKGDHRVWNENPTEIADRLGWLDLPAAMAREVPGLSEFSESVRSGGFRHVVLLGMGGSSLGPEVLRRTFGSHQGYPELRVLDSTLPAWIEAVDSAIDPARTLFLVSSKSGTTIEPSTLYSYYRRRVGEAVGEGRAGGNFIAVTDPGTPLQSLGEREGFRRVFPNPPEIGGRYSVLSFFGMAPAALIGLDLQEILASADCMREACAAPTAGDNPGARLGAAMAALALEGRDKLTLVTSPSLASYGLWVEQMLAESLGKSGKGIIPVAQEPLLSPGSYSSDRIFVYLRLDGGENAKTDALVESLSATHPVIRLELKEKYDLGGEFYRWEFATAVAGHILGVHPFDQPDVQGAKDMTDRVLEEFSSTDSLPSLENESNLRDLLRGSAPGDYLAILSYLPDTPPVNRELQALRHRITDKFAVPTTAGFGPRYLHSTGQLHKGGPNSGLYLQLTADHQSRIPISGRPYTFCTLVDAQAAGDYLALKALGRRIVRAHLGGSVEDGIQGLAADL